MRLLARYIIVAAGSAVFGAAGSCTHAVPYGLRRQRVPWLGSAWIYLQRDDDSTSWVKRSNATAHSCC